MRRAWSSRSGSGAEVMLGTVSSERPPARRLLTPPQRPLRELLGVEGRRPWLSRSVKAAEALGHVGCEADLRLLTVVDDRDAGVDLLPHDVGHCLPDSRLEVTRRNCRAIIPVQQLTPKRLGARQAAKFLASDR